MYTDAEVIDRIDRQIIEMMRVDGRISRRKIAKKLNISPQTVQNRINALEENGIILGYTIITNEKKLGKGVTAFLLVILDRTKHAWSFTEQHLMLRQQDLEIIEMHHITGNWDVVLKIKTRNLDTLENTILKIVNMPGVSRTLTLMCLSSTEYGYEMKRSQPELLPSDLLWNFT
ncbi:MAG: Lrp/AsnC family transcriptional regulator [Promethearchaeota archaeon]